MRLTGGTPVMTSTLERARRLVQTADQDRLDEELKVARALADARAEHADLDVMAFAAEVGASPSRIYRAARLLELCDRLGCDWPSLTPSHLRAVFPAPPEVQRDLLTRAERGGWTVRRLSQETDQIPSQQVHARGRPRTSPLVRTLRELERIAADPVSFEGFEAIARLPRAEVRKILETVDGVADRILALQGSLRRAACVPRPPEPRPARPSGQVLALVQVS